ncbi:hypothetical protein [Bacillus paralicheniformis]|uniref:hypothetical protein n=1 Tax=Bacillus paralicheniformis TaxID=1648923 RepID=UPI002DBDADBE|nr:hypothetical protein [Bacillus paralicheniformis]MEC1866746.1 hypothetical protein [Bacillus paralicheniformis]
MKNLNITTMGNFFVANLEGIEFTVKVVPTGFQTKLEREGKPAQYGDVSCFTEELLERVHETIIEAFLNELKLKDGEIDGITEVLDNQLNGFLEAVVSEGEKAHKFVH